MILLQLTLSTVGLVLLYKAHVKVLDLKPSLSTRQERKKEYHRYSKCHQWSDWKTFSSLASTRIYLYFVVFPFHSPEYLHSPSSEQPFPSIPLTPSSSTTPFTPYSFSFHNTFHILSLCLSHRACLLWTSSPSFHAHAPFHLFRIVKAALEECLSTRALFFRKIPSSRQLLAGQLFGSCDPQTSLCWSSVCTSSGHSLKLPTRAA
jgi:hypothetical protein